MSEDEPLTKQCNLYYKPNFIVLTLGKKAIGLFFVFSYYVLMNMHLYEYIYYYMLKVAFDRHSTPVAIVSSLRV